LSEAKPSFDIRYSSVLRFDTTELVAGCGSLFQLCATSYKVSGEALIAGAGSLIEQE